MRVTRAFGGCFRCCSRIACVCPVLIYMVKEVRIGLSAVVTLSQKLCLVAQVADKTRCLRPFLEHAGPASGPPRFVLLSAPPGLILT